MRHSSIVKKTALVGLGLALFLSLTGCGSNGSGILESNANTPLPPRISASLLSYLSGSDPGNSPNASVTIQDASTSADITTATVTINDTLLTYNADYKTYEGNVSVAPGGTIALSVTAQGKTYSVSTTQFTSYPTISAPVSSTWYAGMSNKFIWSGGMPTTNAVYNIGILDAHDVNGDLVWPTGNNNILEVIPITTTSYVIPANSISAGDRLMLVGIVKGISIPGAAYGSELVIGGSSSLPITISNATLTSIAVTPADPSLPWGTKQQFTAIGTFSDTSTQDLTTQAYWSSLGPVSMDYSVPGLAYADFAGSTTITASLGGISGSTSVTVMPASLQSIQVSPNGQIIARETIKPFSAAGRYADGTVKDITSSVAWSSSNTDVAVISNVSGSNGQATAVSNGTTTISAALNGISGSAALSVTDWPSSPGNYVDLQSDTGDSIGLGQSYSFTQTNAQITLSAVGGYLSITVTGNQQWWFGDFEVPNSFSQLQAGSYENLTRYPFNDPAVGGLDWSGDGRGCNRLTGWFAIDDVTYDSGNLTAIDLRFAQHCENGIPALYGYIHWIK